MKDPHVARNLREILYRKLHNQGDFVSLHIAEKIAQAMDAAYYKVDELKGDQLRSIVKKRSVLADLDHL